jgi:hypothetical protein
MVLDVSHKFLHIYIKILLKIFEIGIMPACVEKKIVWIANTIPANLFIQIKQN